jgi:proline dehydrogenase
MVFYFLGGFTKNEALQTCRRYMLCKQRPILNYAVEGNIQSSSMVLEEYMSLLLPQHRNFDIALKCSSFDEKDRNKLFSVARICRDQNRRMFIDAEEDALYSMYKGEVRKLISVTLDKKYPTVYKTYQMYRKDALGELQDDLSWSVANDIPLGIKMVRGAYHYQDKYSGALFEKKEDTDHSYNWGIMEIAEQKNLPHGTHVVLATHNPFSCSLGFTYNEKTGTRMFSFAHLMGMRENWAVEYTKRQQDVSVYIPYGPIHEMIPYLLRRGYENLDMFKQPWP